jgi:hypothetical protein
MFVEKPSAHTLRRREWKGGRRVGGDDKQVQNRPSLTMPVPVKHEQCGS